LDCRLIFSNFLVGASNQLAYAATQKIALAAPADPLLFNPLFTRTLHIGGARHLQKD